eukprot:m.56128 g.56128  ORF g.56128 m.56128 type:complete len:126 (+) comp11019_c1_seq1:348-725(+)
MLQLVTLVTTLLLLETVYGDGFGYGSAHLSLSVGRVKGNTWLQAEEYLTIPYARAKRFEPPTILSQLPLNGSAWFDATNILGFGQDACMQPPYSSNEKAYGVCYSYFYAILIGRLALGRSIIMTT